MIHGEHNGIPTCHRLMPRNALGGQEVRNRPLRLAGISRVWGSRSQPVPLTWVRGVLGREA